MLWEESVKRCKKRLESLIKNLFRTKGIWWYGIVAIGGEFPKAYVCEGWLEQRA